MEQVHAWTLHHLCGGLALRTPLTLELRSSVGPGLRRRCLQCVEAGVHGQAGSLQTPGVCPTLLSCRAPHIEKK